MSFDAWPICTLSRAAFATTPGAIADCLAGSGRIVAKTPARAEGRLIAMTLAQGG
ncbi:hypothetical protein [Roseovarius spongiae]|uniref:hypothetical protein n=1 Tax=Roseovarius spongiae TaxID=2320272 RepID=UPI001407ED7D|nr:hypothetical protein [Roseovarius spongiae]